LGGAGFQIEQTCKKEGESVEKMKRTNQPVFVQETA